MAGYSVSIERIPEIVVPGKRLGRHVKHDSRSKRYRHKRRHNGVYTSVTHVREIPILNQGDVGSCTGNAMTGALGTVPDYAPLEGRPGGVVLAEVTALALYSAAETIDGDGPYPPNDNGSCGLSVAQAAKNAGLISGYTHCLDLDDVLDALMDGPVIIGSNWYTSMDNPTGPGALVVASGTVRGGHEYEARTVDAVNELIGFDNSWGTSYGNAGSFTMSWITLETLLSQQGDCTVPIPLTQPAPVPSPVTGP
jgi:hypothetical protein